MSILSFIKEQFGHPARLVTLLSERSYAQRASLSSSESIDAEEIPQWHRFGHPDLNDWNAGAPERIMGWRQSGGYYESFTALVPGLQEIGTVEVFDGWECDISQVEGLGASKSPLSDYRDMDRFIEARSPELVREISHDQLRKNLAHREIRILHGRPTSDHFAHYAWDGRIWLKNTGGSHHFAAARYIAKRLDVRVPLMGRLRKYGINPSAVHELVEHFEVFVVPDDAEFSVAFSDAMRYAGITWLWAPMPRPCQSERAIFLPRTERRSRKAAELLREAGMPDLGAHLIGVARYPRTLST
ncbi:DUF6685 family protein [Pandoraea sp. ISTKB]|uniref:DUF6685 family protein n=1 Tax=Pandoraea sp. ISTKB TaxID=1586708 RepID=UPI001112D256|nr:DUF6685 family protein [Pandoraea sp. ISTKB]